MPTIESFDKVKIYYTFHKGSKDTIIFVHGWPHNHTVWNKEARHFSKKAYSTIALDLRGHGKSGKPEHFFSYKMENFAKDIDQIIRKNKIKNPVLVGHSFGGMVCLKFVELFPKKPKCLILLDTTYENPLKDMLVLKHFKLTKFTMHLLNHVLRHRHLQKKHFKEIDFSKFKDHSDFFYWVKGAKNTSIDSLLFCLKDMLLFDETKNLGRIAVPCLIIEGEKDSKTPQKVAKNMNKKIKNSKLVIVKNTTHDTNIRKSKLVNRIIEGFMEGQP